MALSTSFPFKENRLEKMFAGTSEPKFSTDRTPRVTSNARLKGFNLANARKFFELCGPEFRKISSQPHRCLMVDETGTTVVQHKHSDVTSLKGEKRK
jgi:hypothetical protein